MRTIRVIGPEPFERDAGGLLRTRIATLFVEARVLVTVPGIHASQRQCYLVELNRERAGRGRPPLTEGEKAALCARSVDLILEPDVFEIRPVPDEMELAFAADELLQEEVLKPQIRFLNVNNRAIREAMRRRGELWRISALPRSQAEMQALIQGSRVAIQERALYYHNRYTGTRYVTLAEFAALEALPADALARQLGEIAAHGVHRNRLGNAEVSFFGVPEGFAAQTLAGTRFAELAEPDLRARYAGLREKLAAAVPPELQKDDLEDEVWRNRMFGALVDPGDGTVTEEVLAGLAPGFYLQIRWLPGGRFEEGELIFDGVFEQAKAFPDNPRFIGLCDAKVRQFIFSFIREEGILDYVNVGRIETRLSRGPAAEGRRAVYLAELKPHDQAEPKLRFLRLQKYDVVEHLAQGKPLDQACLESQEYTEYVLDRRLGCWHLGMNVLLKVAVKQLREPYRCSRPDCQGLKIPVTYFDREYLPGIATDKVPASKYRIPGYATRFATLLGAAAAANCIVGRADERTGIVVFDQGDEVVIEGDDGLPTKILVGDHAGSFAAYAEPDLAAFAPAYARPVNLRADRVPDSRAFALAYLAGFEERLRHVQEDYRRRRMAFETLFRHCHYDKNGSFAFRWECVLKRLDGADVSGVVNAIRQRIAFLPLLQAAAVCLLS